MKSVATGEARPFDKVLRQKIAVLRSPSMDIVSAVLTATTSPALLIACCVAVAVRFRHLGLRVWLPIASSPLVAMIAGRCFTEILPQQYAPTSKDGERECCFPSGHTTGAAAEMFTLAYILRRSGVVSVPITAAIAIVPIAGGMNRLYRDRHWTSDIVAGLSAGTAIATALTSIEPLDAAQQ
ncbi:MAG: phosphatase PAP2 family protein [Thermoanaerobaculia bacterium]